MVSDHGYDLSERVIRDIIRFAGERDVDRVILFGSRARRTNSERSDVDIAVSGGDFNGFYDDIKDKTHSLLMFDIVNLDNRVTHELTQEIERDGIVLYEKA